MRRFALQLLDLLGALSEAIGTAEVEELRTVAIVCGAGLDASLLSPANGWM